MPIAPDDKDWTWILERTCPECGFDAAGTPYAAVPGLLRAAAERFGIALARPNIALRPNDSTWSTLEYGAHVRDVCRLMTHRLDVALGRPGAPPTIVGLAGTVGLADGLPVFENWDQDATAEAARYRDQNPETVTVELAEAAETVAHAFESVPTAHHIRAARRTNGSLFTVESLARYCTHDLVHHLHDIGA